MWPHESDPINPVIHKYREAADDLLNLLSELQKKLRETQSQNQQLQRENAGLKQELQQLKLQKSEYQSPSPQTKSSSIYESPSPGVRVLRQTGQHQSDSPLQIQQQAQQYAASPHPSPVTPEPLTQAIRPAAARIPPPRNWSKIQALYHQKQEEPLLLQAPDRLSIDEANQKQRRSQSDTALVFKTNTSSQYHYFTIAAPSGQHYMALPKIGMVFTPPILEMTGLNILYDISGTGNRIAHIEAPALLQKQGERFSLLQKGSLRLQ